MQPRVFAADHWLETQTVGGASALLFLPREAEGVRRCVRNRQRSRINEHTGVLLTATEVTAEVIFYYFFPGIFGGATF